jgi:hypothetical protein
VRDGMVFQKAKPVLNGNKSGEAYQEISFLLPLTFMNSVCWSDAVRNVTFLEVGFTVIFSTAI